MKMDYGDALVMISIMWIVLAFIVLFNGEPDLMDYINEYVKAAAEYKRAVGILIGVK